LAAFCTVWTVKSRVACMMTALDLFT
jgi:hypothetical protein